MNHEQIRDLGAIFVVNTTPEVWISCRDNIIYFDFESLFDLDSQSCEIQTLKQHLKLYGSSYCIIDGKMTGTQKEKMS